MKLLLVFLAGAVFTPVVGDARNDLNKLHRDFFSWRMEDRPVSATVRGIYKYNDKLESYNMSMFEPRKDKAQEFLTKLQDIPKTDLTRSDLMNYQILENMLETYIEGFQWWKYNYLNPMNFLEGAQLNPGSFAGAHPFDTIGDFENYLERLRLYPEQLQEYKALFEEAIRLNRTQHNVSVSRIPGHFEALQVDDPTYSPFYRPFNDTLENSTIPDTDKEDIRGRAKPLVKSLLEAFKNLGDFFQTEYMPKTRTGYGVLHLENGKEFYKACIKWYLAQNMTAEQIHAIGLEEVAAIETKMKVIMDKNGFSGSVADYFKDLMANPDNMFKTGEEMMDTYRNQIHKEIEPTLPKQFQNLPGLPIIVVAMTNDGPVGAYSSGSADGSRPGIFWANIMRPTETPKFTAMALTIHEANPGHHLQISYSITADTPDFRQKMEGSSLFRVPFAFPRYTAFVEGWALYSEALGEELGLYKDDLELMGRYSSEMFRACRLVVDTGIHHFGWDKERAIEYFLNYTAESRDAIEVEVDRYITWPGQALAYKIGEIKIRQLRKLAQDKLGDKFDIKGFHAAVLESGTVPLNILDQNVNHWINIVLSQTPPVDPCVSDASRLTTEFTVLYIAFLILFRIYL